MKIKKKYELVKIAPEQLRWECDTSRFNFSSTIELEELDEIIGQPRAVESIRLGAKLYARGYNIFVTGLSGTGRLTTVKRLLEQLDTKKPKLYDFCYVNNFKQEQTPHLLRLNQGEGRDFAKAMDDAIGFLKMQIAKMFEEEPYQSGRRQLLQSYQKREKDILLSFDKELEPLGFVRGHLETEQGAMQPEVFVVVGEKAFQVDELDDLVLEKKITPEQALNYKDTYRTLHQRLFDMAREGMKMMKVFKEEVANYDKNAAKRIVEPTLDELKEKFTHKTVDVYLNEVKDNVLDNLIYFIPSNNAGDPNFEYALAEYFNVFKVNIVLDNSETKSPPIVIERNPTYTNLFGTLDREMDNRGLWKTDFSKIRSGSILKADQGYLIVSAQDLFFEYGVWNTLKRVLLYSKLEIQPLESVYQASMAYIKPEPIDVNVKVVIIGGQTLYNYLYYYEKGFKKIFKINAQFDYITERSDELIDKYARFIAKICNKENLSHCSPDGVAAVVEWAVEHAGSQNKMTLKMSDVADLVRESSFYSEDTKQSSPITRYDVEKAIEWRYKRSDMIDERLTKYILEGTLLIDVKGQRIGQINGLTVMDNGIISFGKPARITCTVGAGSAGIINIEREAQMSGAIHNKGVMIIIGFLVERFAQLQPLAFTASIAFEQSYGGIDGDSASVAEIYALLSALTQKPLNQQIAVTGSVNQKGDIQPIGGVNEKIRGFYEICKHRGFTGKQGVVIPVQNVGDLMLGNDIIQDVKNGNFTIYSMEKIEDPSELFTGLPFGHPSVECKYEPGTLLCIARERLEILRKSATGNDTENQSDMTTENKKTRKRKSNLKRINTNSLRKFGKKP